MIKKSAAKQLKHTSSQKNFEPTKMSFLVAAAAAVCLVVLGLIATHL
jgi:hypothetical protein